MLNYDRLATEYAQHRQVHPEVLRMLLTQGALDASVKVLEVGCGTGNYSRAIAEAVGCACWGIDPSAQMLAHARSRTDQVIFQQDNAEQLAFPAAMFDLIFSVDVIHHVGNRFAYFQAAQRVLRAGGKFCTVTDSETMIRQRQPLSVYFPSTIAVELARYPRLSDLCAYLDQLGFVDVQTFDVEFAYAETDIERYRAKAYSCLHLLAKADFQQGIMRMEQALRQGPLPCVTRYTLPLGNESSRHAMSNESNQTNFNGQVALVTGGTRGIGRAITLALAQAGCQVVACYRSDHAAATALCQEATAQGWRVAAQCADVSDRPAVDQLIAGVLQQSGRLDILVNNAGLFPRTAVLEMSDEAWDSVLRTNLYSAFYCTRAVLPTMMAAKEGIIINVASIAGQRGSAYHAHYAAAKGGLLAFTRSLAREVIQHNIRVNAVSPGRIETEMMLAEASASERVRWQSDTPIRRLGTPEEVAAAVVFLASPASAYIVGETLAVNGGLLME